MTCKVTLPDAGTLTLKALKVADVPANPTGPATGLPLLRRLIPLIPLGFPVPASDTVRLVKFTGVVPRLVNTTEITETPDAPGNWVVFGGAGEPVENCTVSGVGVKVEVAIGLLVAVLVGVRVGEFVAVLVKVLVRLFVGVVVGVFVGCEVPVKVRVGVEVMVTVGLLVGVRVAVLGGVIVGV